MPDSPYLTKTTGSKLAWLVLGLLCIELFTLGFFYMKFDSNQKDFEKVQRRNAMALVDNNRSSCELGKVGSQQLANFETAQATYISSVTGAKSVKEDVKTAARKALAVFKVTSAGAQRRAHRDCLKAFPYNTKGFG